MTDQMLRIDRRTPSLPTRDALVPERLLANQIEASRHQLDEAREDLKGSRRRVGELEGALTNWEHFACALLARRDRDRFNAAG